MINSNGTIYSKNTQILHHTNRAFKYGDGIFETLKVQQGNLFFWEDHYFRLMASMRMLRMKIPMAFTLEFLQQEILKTVSSAEPFRVRLSVYRKDGGLYTPETNEVDYLIEATPFEYETKERYEIDIFKDFYTYSGLLSTVKTNNRMLNTVASVYAQENELDSCILLNERKGVVETTNGNIFIRTGNLVKTPALTEGCIQGIMRKKVIEHLEKHAEYQIEQTVISPFEIQKAEEVFVTNAIMGIQPVTHYRKKTFTVAVAPKLAASIKVSAITLAN